MEQDDDDRLGRVIDLASHKPIEQTGWMNRLQHGDKGLKATLANAMLILTHDPVLKGMVGYNAFRSEHQLMRAPPKREAADIDIPGPYPRTRETEDALYIQAYLQDAWTSQFTRTTTEDAMLAVARRNSFHPVTDWLDTLVWDRVPRLDTWLIQAYGCEDTPYHRSVGAMFLIAAVRRVRQPGYKFDNMLILEGKQRLGKSLSLVTLFGQPWSSAQMPLDLGGRHAGHALQGVWCMECAEVDHLIRNEDETAKAFLSRPYDHYLPPYGRTFVDRPRQTVFVGTANRDDYLRDVTGNTRYWPVPCAGVSIDWIRLNRDALWAEAAHRATGNEVTFLADEEVIETATEAQIDRMASDVWDEIIEDWLDLKVEAAISDILYDAIGMPRERQGKREEMRVGRILVRLGWWKKKVRRETKTIWRWFAPGYDP